LFWRTEESSAIPPASLPLASSLPTQAPSVDATPQGGGASTSGGVSPGGAPRGDKPTNQQAKAKEAKAKEAKAKDAKANGAVTIGAKTNSKNAPRARRVSPPSMPKKTNAKGENPLPLEPVSSLGKLLGISSESEGTYKKFWMPDELSNTCYDCETVFSTFKRRHHCRACGQVFCSKYA